MCLSWCCQLATIRSVQFAANSQVSIYSNKFAIQKSDLVEFTNMAAASHISNKPRGECDCSQLDVMMQNLY